MSKRFLDWFCPLTKHRCRTDCMWSYSEVELDEEGARETIKCAINLIAESIEGEEWEEYA